MTGNVVRTFDDVQGRFESADARTLTATVAGASILADTTFVTVTSSVATKIVNLPAAVTGKQIQVFCGANGCELRSDVAADKVNNVVVGATNEAALIAGTLYSLRYNSGNWVMTGLTALGAVEAPVVPNAV